jgi:diguanylate cyclase (GGDEF)-like protein/PAS domain S-box-containing protein
MMADKDKEGPSFEFEETDFDLLKADGDLAETIDVGALFTSEFTDTGSFDVSMYDQTGLGKLLNGLPIPAMMISRSGTVIFANASCEKIASDNGISPGLHFQNLFTRQDQAERAQELFKRVISQGKPQVGEVLFGRDRRKVVGRLHLRSVRAWDEHLILAVVEDLTAEKKKIIIARKHQELSRQTREELENRVQDRTAELINANKKLQYEIAYRKRAEVLLRKSESKFRAMFETAPVAIMEIEINALKAAIQTLRKSSKDDFPAHLQDNSEFLVEAWDLVQMVDVNDAAVKLYHASGKSELLKTPSILAPEAVDLFREIVLAIADETPVVEIETITRTCDRKLLNVLVRAALPVPSSPTKRAIITIMDITQLKQAQEALAMIKREWERTFDAVPDLLAIMDMKHKVIRVNKAMALRVGKKAEEIVGQHCFELFHQTRVPLQNCPHKKLITDGKQHVAEIADEYLGGTFMVSVTPLTDDNGDLIGCVHVARDITERKRLEEKLTLLATSDPLTGLLNRRHFMESLGMAYRNAKRYGHPLSVCLCDLDYFKFINDTYGHQAGDKVLAVFGEIIRYELRSTDIAGRYGGDEFILAFPHTNAIDARECLERVRLHLQRIVFKEENSKFQATCTAGIAELHHELNAAESLVRSADKALYEGKALGRNQVVILKRT